MEKSSNSINPGGSAGSTSAAADGVSETTAAPPPPDGIAEKHQMVEKLFRHTNQFLEENKRDPLLVVEALAAILVRYAALLGPVEQLNDRLSVLERLIGQESAQIKEIAKTAPWSKQG